MAKQESALERWTRHSEPVVTRLTRVMLAISGVCTAVMAVIVTYSVIMRSVFNSPQLWGFDIASLAMVGAGVCAIGPALIRGQHVQVRMLLDALPNRASSILAGIGLLAGIPWVTIVMLYSWKMAETSRRLGYLTYSTLGTPQWPLQIALAVGMGLFAVLMIWLGTRLIWSAVEGRKVEPVSHKHGPGELTEGQ